MLPSAENSLSFDVPVIQVAGVRSIAEASMLMSAGVDLIGIPLRLAVHTPDVTDDEARKIFNAIITPHRGVLITYLSDPKAVLELTVFLGVNAVQLHGPVEPETLAELRRRAPRLLIIKSLIAGREPVSTLLDQMMSRSENSDAFITDTYDPESGASGATGKTHDWRISREIVVRSPKPVILAGGLTPVNVGDAIRAVRPAGVDVHTGVEDPAGSKDPEKVAAFVREARTAFASIKKEADQ